MPRQLLVRVFLGSREGQSRPYFTNAVGVIKSIYREKIIFEYLDTDMMKRAPYRFTEKQFIDWFLAADIHILVGHMHQGLDHLCWDIQELLEEYKRLKDHIGFTGGALDPVFLQDKIAYLLALNEDDYLPTIRIDMPPTSDDGEVLIRVADLEKIQR